VKIGTPVECQNGHKATYVIEINDLFPNIPGVSEEEKCDCPKWDFGEGWKSVGEPFIITKNKKK